MTNDNRLVELTEQNTFAREIYYIRRGQERSRSRRGLDATDHAKWTAQADLAWMHSEKELSTYRGIPQRPVVDAR